MAKLDDDETEEEKEEYVNRLLKVENELIYVRKKIENEVELLEKKGESTNGQ